MSRSCRGWVASPTDPGFLYTSGWLPADEGTTGPPYMVKTERVSDSPPSFSTLTVSGSKIPYSLSQLPAHNLFSLSEDILRILSLPRTSLCNRKSWAPSECSGTGRIGGTSGSYSLQLVWSHHFSLLVFYINISPSSSSITDSHDRSENQESRPSFVIPSFVLETGFGEGYPLLVDL